MHDRVRAIIEKLPKSHRWVVTASKSPKHPHGGNHVSPTHILERLKRLLRKLKLDGHRHTFPQG